MLERKGRCSQVTLIVMFLFFATVIDFTPLIAEHGKVTEFGTKMIPIGAILFNLNSSVTSNQFATDDFYPEAPHIGRYNIHILVRIFIDSLKSNSDLKVQNLWNVCDPIWNIKYEELGHQDKSYYYHRPTVSDTDFSVVVELTDTSGTANDCWIWMDFLDDGETSPPTDFTMPPSTCSNTDTSTGEESTNTNEKTSSEITTSSISSGMKRITFPILFSIVGIYSYLLYKNRIKNT